ncbi:MAG: ABC transporter substrate-binding protein [Candidatus Thiodiazotropha weberae]|nr:ABC transporter substrate-binding protein [Candidatus Thiodiazotropha lotti]MCG7932048.1 ABC transporter substrate-binding protein [Candidatus Thiodiazotropha lotti]MCG7988193.1 ABC transporter substrate-binding protein [Candidatus Thiodiazotropha lotti]MCG8013822.1 ABC transporter substrate-binding protein [Candidatus Thiodiazotropha lotti]MCG8020882.1 ABC transporter substrate-binding protein [Candidatus Thiodiazotropha lotti]
MSYEQDNPWCQEIKEGIDRVMADSAELTYFYMNTKVDLQGGREKAKEAYELYEELKPDGIITVDDNAQSMFVVPYLKDRVSTPVFFCGVNNKASAYGYPNQHISGTLERGHIRESIAFLKQLIPDVENICFIVRSSPSGHAIKSQVESEQSTYIVPIEHFLLLTDSSQIEEFTRTRGAQCNAIYVDSLEGTTDINGKPMDNREVIDFLKNNYKGPVIGGNSYHVEDGAVSAVAKTGQEQGEIAAGMLLKALNGTPMEKLPVTRNYKGRRYINVNSIKELGIQPRPIVLRGATLVTTPK